MSYSSSIKTGTQNVILTGMQVGKLAPSIFPIYKINKYIQEKLKLDENLHGVALENEIFDKVYQLIPENKKKLLYELSEHFGKAPGLTGFKYVIPELNLYKEECVKNPRSQLKNEENVSIETKYPYDNMFSHLGMQYLHIEFEKPELAEKYELAENEEILYDYPHYPGIRLLEKIERKANNMVYDSYNMYDVLKYNNDAIEANSEYDWKDLMGEDNGVDAEKYDIITQTTQVQKIKNGYQTPKSNPDELIMDIPLLFPHCLQLSERLNLLLFSERTLTYEFTFTKSVNMVRARIFNTADVTVPPVLVQVKPLKIRKISLFNKMTSYLPLIHSLNYEIPFNKLARYNENKSIFVTTEEDIQDLSGKGLVDHFAFAFRPKSYRNDFDKWHELSTVKELCTSSVSLMPDPLNPGEYKGVVAPFVTKKCVEVLEKLELRNDQISITISDDPKIFKKLDVYDKSKNNPDFHTRNNCLYYIFFNQYPNGSYINCLYNMQFKPCLYYKFKKEFKQSIENESLIEEYEIIAWRVVYNVFIGAGDNIAKREIQS